MSTTGLCETSAEQAYRARRCARMKYFVSLAYSLDVCERPQKKLSIYQFGSLLDISGGGVCFRAKGEFAIPSLISIYLKLTKDSSGIKMLGKVIWVKNISDGYTLVGIKFIGSLPLEWIRLIQGNSTEHNL